LVRRPDLAHETAVDQVGDETRHGCLVEAGVRRQRGARARSPVVEMAQHEREVVAPYVRRVGRLEERARHRRHPRQLGMARLRESAWPRAAGSGPRPVAMKLGPGAEKPMPPPVRRGPRPLGMMATTRPPMTASMTRPRPPKRLVPPMTAAAT